MKRVLFIILILFLLPCRSWAQQNLEDSLNKIIALNKNDGEMARAYTALGYEYSRKDKVKAKANFFAAIAIGKKINDLKKLSSTYAQLVYLYYDLGKTDSAEHYLNIIEQLSQNANATEKDALNSSYYIVAGLYYKRTGDKQKSISFFEKAIPLLIKSGDKAATAGQYLNLGNTYITLGNYQKGAEMLLKALHLFEEIGNQRGMSFCYNGLSNSFTELKQYTQALNYANKAMQIKVALNDRKGLGTAENGLANIYLGLGDFDNALNHFNASLNYAIEQKSLPDEQRIYFNIAKVYAAKKDKKNTIEYFNKSKVLSQQLHDSLSTVEIDAELIALQSSPEKTALSENKLQTTITLFKEKGDLSRQTSGFKNMADFYIANNQFDKALEYTNKYHQAIDSIKSNDLQMQIRKMEEQYTVEKKEKEIVLLKKDKELQQQKLFKQRLLFAGAALLLLLALCGIWLLMNRNKLRQRMKELELRNQIAADLHDEVGSSLSSIHMLSQMATQHDDDTKHKDILARMSSNAKETMDKMGDIVWMIKPNEAEGNNLKPRMENFAYEICSSKNIVITVMLDEVEKVKLTMVQRKNLYLIFKEAVNNAVKYSDTEKMDITSSTENKKLVLQIKDFGKGFNTALIKKGNGLDNMQKRAADSGAVLQLQSSTGKGTTVTLQLPIQ